MIKLKGRSVLFYVNLATALLALISAIVFAIIDNSDASTFSVAVVVLMIIGALVQCGTSFFDYFFLPIIPVIFYGTAVGVHIDAILVSLSDLWTGVNLYHGNNVIAIIFGVLFLACAIEAVVNCFLKKQTTVLEVKYEDS